MCPLVCWSFARCRGRCCSQCIGNLLKSESNWILTQSEWVQSSLYHDDQDPETFRFVRFV